MLRAGRCRDGRCGFQGLYRELGQPLCFRFQHLRHHVPNFFQGQACTGERVKRGGSYHEFRVAGKRRFHRKPLRGYVGLVKRGQLCGQRAHTHRVQSHLVGKHGHFRAAALRQVGDIAVVAHIALELEGYACFQRFQNVRAVFHTTLGNGGRFFCQHIYIFEFVCNQSAPAQVGARFAAEGRFVAVGIQRPFTAPEPRHIFRKMACAFGHEIAEMPHNFDAHLFVDVVFGQFALLLEQGIEVLALVFHFQEPAHVVDARRHIVNVFFRQPDITGDQIERGLHAVAQSHILQAGVFAQRPADRRHGVDVVQQGRVRAEFFHILHNVHHHRDGA